MSQSSIRQVQGILGNVFTCKHCGGRKTINATAWRGHGTGRRGESYYGATNTEAIHPSKHCVCVGGPVWWHLAHIHGEAEFRACQQQWEQLPDKEQWAVYYDDEDKGIYQIPLGNWKQGLIEHWDEAQQKGAPL